MSSHLNFLNDDDKVRRRNEEVKESLRKINNKIQKTKPNNYYESTIDEEDKIRDVDEKVEKQSYIKEDKPTSAIKKDNITSFSQNSHDDASIFKMLSVILGVLFLLTGAMLVFGSTFGFFKETSANITNTCAPQFNEGNTSVHCSDFNSSCNCPQINISLLCGSIYNTTNQSYYYNISNST